MLINDIMRGLNEVHMLKHNKLTNLIITDVLYKLGKLISMEYVQDKTLIKQILNVINLYEQTDDFSIVFGEDKEMKITKELKKLLLRDFTECKCEIQPFEFQDKYDILKTNLKYFVLKISKNKYIAGHIQILNEIIKLIDCYDIETINYMFAKIYFNINIEDRYLVNLHVIRPVIDTINHINKYKLFKYPSEEDLKESIKNIQVIKLKGEGK